MLRQFAASWWFVLPSFGSWIVEKLSLIPGFVVVICSSDLSRSRDDSSSNSFFLCKFILFFTTVS